MFQASMIAVLTACLCMQLSSGQIAGVLTPVDNFISAFNTGVYSSNILPEIFDLSALSPNAFSRSLYDFVYADSVQLGHGNPYLVASTLTMPLTAGIDALTLPLMLDINGHAIGNCLLSRGVLNSSNAANLAQQYVRTLEDAANRRWIRGTPESKFSVLNDGFKDFMIAINQHNANTVEDLARSFASEVKRLGAQ